MAEIESQTVNETRIRVNNLFPKKTLFVDESPEQSDFSDTCKIVFLSHTAILFDKPEPEEKVDELKRPKDYLVISYTLHIFGG